MFARFRRSAPAPAANGNTTLNAETAKLQNALNKIANLHVKKYANALRVQAKANANAARANAAAAVAPTPTNVANAVKANNQAAVAQQNANQAEKAAAAVVNAAPEVPAHTATVVAENATVNAVIKNIQNMNKPLNINAIRTGNVYTTGSNNNRKRINNSINARKKAAIPFSN